MQKIIRKVDEVRGVHQITIADERWYSKQIMNPATGVPEMKFVPSVTWIASKYPKGIGFYKWLADKGWEESQAIKVAAGDKGSKVHEAISDIIGGYEVRMDSKYLNRSNGRIEELSLEEYDGVASFARWNMEVKPKWIAWDFNVFHDLFDYAGTIDAVCEIDGVLHVVDFKTSKDVWPEYELQVSAYLKVLQDGFHEITGPKLDFSAAKLAILQVGYTRNKNRYKWNEIDFQFPLFLASRQIWEKECGGEQPTKREYPIIISPGKKKDVPVNDGSFTEKGEQIITL